MVIMTLYGETRSPMPVMVHCAAGKHRSGAVAIFFIMVIEGVDLETAKQRYFKARGLWRWKDLKYVNELCETMNWPELVTQLGNFPWLKEALKSLRAGGGIEKAVVVRPGPQAKPAYEPPEKRPRHASIQASSGVQVSTASSSSSGIQASSGVQASTVSTSLLRPKTWSSKEPAAKKLPKAAAKQKRVTKQFPGLRGKFGPSPPLLPPPLGMLPSWASGPTPPPGPPPPKPSSAPRPIPPSVPPPPELLGTAPIAISDDEGEPEAAGEDAASRHPGAEDAGPGDDEQEAAGEDAASGHPSAEDTGQGECLDDEDEQEAAGEDAASGHPGAEDAGPGDDEQEAAGEDAASGHPGAEDAGQADEKEFGEDEEEDEADLSGLWQCKECTCLNRSHKLFCQSCDTYRPSLFPVLPGDWFCGACGNHNFARREKCIFRDCPTLVIKPHDWICPTCGNHNYARREVCNARRCNTRKPATA